MSIHRTALVHPEAKIHSSVEIGPYVVVDGQVEIKARTRVMAHAYLTGWTEIGVDNEIHPGAVIGAAPQDKAYMGAETYLKWETTSSSRVIASCINSCALAITH
jgi:UDP-N-acetylglucosamine acyltransferase